MSSSFEEIPWPKDEEVFVKTSLKTFRGSLGKVLCIEAS